MKTKAMIFGAAAIASSMLMAADTPEVENVVMTQASFGRMVTVTYKLKNAADGAVVTFDVETNTLADASGEWVSIGGAAVCNARGAVWRKVTAADADSEGKYTITWRPDLSWEGHKVSLADGGARAVVTAWALDNTPNYMVVDISAAAKPNTQRYYTSANFLPGGLFGNPDYRTTSLVMRKIEAKDVTWTMGSTASENQSRNAAREGTHQVTLTNNYYIGVYEVTQSQWSQIATNSSIGAKFAMEGSMRPMETVCYNEIRLKANSKDAATTSEISNYSWPKSPNPSSFLGILRSKTGINFDLPSEAQWEFAARAGNGCGYWNDGSPILNKTPDENLNLLGRNEANGGMPQGKNPDDNVGPTNGTAIVGSYAPSNWGLYDMHGNVNEWCLDWYTDNILEIAGKVNIDPEDPARTLSNDSSGSTRVRKGGTYYGGAGSNRPAYRSGSQPTARDTGIGIRVVCTAGLK